MKNNIKLAAIAILLGIILGKYIFNQYKEDVIDTMNVTNNQIYIMQYGVYKNEDNMKESAKELKNYFYYTDEKGYHVIIGITTKESLKDKIVDSYDIKTDIYMKKIQLDNEEFLRLLEQYDSLIEQTTDKDIIVSAEKQILSKYEEILTDNE